MSRKAWANVIAITILAITTVLLLWLLFGCRDSLPAVSTTSRATLEAPAADYHLGASDPVWEALWPRPYSPD